MLNRFALCRTSRAIRLVPALVACCALAACVTSGTKPPEATEDGLVLTKSKRVDLLYKQPDASLRGYTKVWLKPMTVSFSEAWDPKAYGPYGIQPGDVKMMREVVAQLVFETMSEQLTEAKYVVVTGPGEGVLEVQGRLVNLFIKRPLPERISPNQIRSDLIGETIDSNELTLVVELRDSITGTVLARGRDREKGLEGHLLGATSGLNKADAKFFAKQWAKTLIKALDAAKEEAK